MDNPKRILVAPLNWGLGHATRCMPLIAALQAGGAEVVLASDGAARLLLEQEYPDLPIFPLPTYHIRYPGRNMLWNMAWQLPRISQAINRERKALRKLVQQEKIDIVISDNRYGCYTKSTTNIFLTHQLHIKAPAKIMEQGIYWINRWLIRRFDECWIPDVAGTPNLSGELSHPPSLPNCHYLGLLSRMRRYDCPLRYDLVVVLSGPEPQRTYLEEKILSQLRSSKKDETARVLLVQGLPGEQKRVLEGNVEKIAYLTSRDLNEALLSAGMLLCRSGYSSLMDLVQLGRPALLIPTPGQTEQEYLAEHLMAEGLFYTVTQDALDLEKDLAEAKTYPGFRAGAFAEGVLTERVQQLLAQ